LHLWPLSCGQNLEIEGNYAGPDVLLEALPTSPGAAVQTKGPLHGGNDGLYASPEVAWAMGSDPRIILI